ncbi:MAG: Rrf2 family transcriptional regulator [Castellaniella sp.]|uniref:RrF2 family transcriptional regulator n=1 Tax=Castellaniella sp. TaxID=1955812 RepID=UPI002A371F35|nr:Rrf2 family transcriptional regulator [Castellaniella sp.]MDY0308383.1 Rrf2 family transcriptional regulator [Castellaniella sp.]
MRLTNMSDYAVRLLIYLGSHRDRLCTIAEIAQAYRISEPHLMKITHRLAQRGWIRTVRGKNGGMELAHEPGEIRLGALIRDMENDLALVECMGTDNHCILNGHCGLKPIIAGAMQAFMDHLDAHTLADVIPSTPSAAIPIAPERVAADGLPATA